MAETTQQQTMTYEERWQRACEYEAFANELVAASDSMLALAASYWPNSTEEHRAEMVEHHRLMAANAQKRAEQYRRMAGGHVDDDATEKAA